MFVALALSMVFVTFMLAENGLNTWLRFEASEDSTVHSPVHTAGQELMQGI